MHDFHFPEFHLTHLTGVERGMLVILWTFRLFLSGCGRPSTGSLERLILLSKELCPAESDDEAE